MSKMKIVVTGGAGLIGSWVVDYLLKEFSNDLDQIVILDNFVRGTKDNLKDALKSDKIKLVRGDIRDIKTVNEIIKGANFVVHEAAIRITQCAEDPRLCNEVLVDGTFNIFEACVNHGVKKLVFNSSASVYGQPLKLPMKETDTYNNDTAYGAAKIANEQMAKAFRRMYGLNYIALRPFNVYGPRMDIYGVYTEVLIKWLDRIDQGLSPVIFGDGSNTLDFIYVEDIARATICALKSDLNQGVYNVGSGKQVSLKQLAYALLKVSSSKLEPTFEPDKSKANYATKRQAYILNAKNDLGFVAKTSLEYGLKKLIDWRKETKSKK